MEKEEERRRRRDRNRHRSVFFCVYIQVHDQLPSVPLRHRKRHRVVRERNREKKKESEKERERDRESTRERDERAAPGNPRSNVRWNYQKNSRSGLFGSLACLVCVVGRRRKIVALEGRASQGQQQLQPLASLSLPLPTLSPTRSLSLSRHFLLGV